MVKKGRYNFSRIIVLVILLLIINSVYLIFKYNSYPKTSGYSIKDDVYEFYQSMPKDSKVFLLIQWLVIIGLLIFISFKEKISLNLKAPILTKGNTNIGSETDLDSLYNSLKEKKQIPLMSITRSYNVSKEIVMEWGKILESGNLAIIDYSSTGEPILKLIDSENKIKKIENTL